MNQKRLYNVLTLFGQLSVGLQALSCMVFAVLLLIAGGVFFGSNYDLVPAVVDKVQCDLDENVCGVAVTYSYQNKKYTSTFETIRAPRYTPGDVVYIRVNPAHPAAIAEDLPWRSMGLGFMSAAVALGYLSWYAIHIVSDDRNIAALAGSVSVLQTLL